MELTQEEKYKLQNLLTDFAIEIGFKASKNKYNDTLDKYSSKLQGVICQLLLKNTNNKELNQR
jgi:hypothetical protein